MCLALLLLLSLTYANDEPAIKHGISRWVLGSITGKVLQATSAPTIIELAAKLQGVLAVLYAELGRRRLVARTKRHLYASVVALRTPQDDHLDYGRGIRPARHPGKDERSAAVGGSQASPGRPGRP